jgi:hypothetical protein
VALVAALVFLVLNGSDGDERAIESPDGFLERVEAALRGVGEVTHVAGEMTGTDGTETYQLFTSDAWYDFEAGAVRVSMRKAPGSSLDVADEVLQLRVGDDVYTALPGTDAPTERSSHKEWTACLYNEPPRLAMGLLCGLGPQGGEALSMEVEGRGDFRGRQVRALAAHMTDGRTLRLYVDPDSYLPVGQTMSVEAAARSFALETVFQVQGLARSSIPSDFFDPRSLGYVPPEEVWLGILDDPALGVDVHWPGRAITGTGSYDAVLISVDDRRGPPDKNSPAHVVTLTFRGNGGVFRLDYWPGDSWEALLALLGPGFLWSSCAAEETYPMPVGEVTVLLGFEPEAGLGALAPPQVAVPGTTPSTSVPAFDPFPNGCPAGDHDRFMAVVRVEGGVVTVNAPYGLCCQDGDSFGVFDTPEGLRAIAEKLRLRQPGE